MSKCRFCGHRNPAGAEACKECGATFLDHEREPALDPGAESDRILEMLRNGQKIAAIKFYREQHDVGLKEAKDAVENLACRAEPTDQTANDESGPIVELLRSGRKIAAVKLYREQHGGGLKQAKGAVENLARQHGIASSGGCAAVLLSLIAVATLAGMIL